VPALSAGGIPKLLRPGGFTLGPERPTKLWRSMRRNTGRSGGSITRQLGRLKGSVGRSFYRGRMRAYYWSRSGVGRRYAT
jgi:hypothetical protein